MEKHIQHPMHEIVDDLRHISACYKQDLKLALEMIRSGKSDRSQICMSRRCQKPG